MTKSNGRPLVRVENLKKHFPITRGLIFQREIGTVRAVDGIDMEIMEGETLGLVGESGCGKSTTGRTILQLYKPTSGKVFYEDTDLTTLDGDKLRKARRNFQMIFQDPYASLNPRLTVEQIIAEPLEVHNIGNKKERHERVKELMSLVGLNPSLNNRYPHEFSGGQRQRIGVARALAVEPEFIVADEPLSALDVSIQAQVVNLLCDLRDRLSLTMLFISHDLDVVEYLCDRVVVLYLGRVMEVAPTVELFARPLHPYSQALLAASPKPDPEQKNEHIALTGDIPSPVNPPSGCVFRTRCPHVIDVCASTRPELRDMGQGRFKACIRDDIAMVATP